MIPYIIVRVESESAIEMKVRKLVEMTGQMSCSTV